MTKQGWVISHGLLPHFVNYIVVKFNQIVASHRLKSIAVCKIKYLVFTLIPCSEIVRVGKPWLQLQILNWN
jgi:hypothetical protein